MLLPHLVFAAVVFAEREYATEALRVEGLSHVPTSKCSFVPSVGNRGHMRDTTLSATGSKPLVLVDPGTD